MFSARIGFFATVTPPAQDFMVASVGTPFLTAYPWVDGDGFGTKYANPATSLTTAQISVSFSPNNGAVLSTQSSGAFTNAYKWTLSTGFGTKYANPGQALTTTPNDSGWANTNTDILFGLNTTPYLTSYAFTIASGYGTRYGAPATIPAGAVQTVATNSAGNCVAVAHSTSPYISVYAFTSGTGFGTKFANPSSLGTQGGVAVTFAYSDNYIIYGDGGSGSGVVRTYAWNNTTGFGSLSPTLTLPGNTNPGIYAINIGGVNRVIVGASNLLTMTNFPSSALVTSVSVGFSSNWTNINSLGTVASIVGNTTPYAKVYPITSSSSFGTVYNNPGTLPGATGNDSAWTN